MLERVLATLLMMAVAAVGVSLLTGSLLLGGLTPVVLFVALCYWSVNGSSSN